MLQIVDIWCQRVRVRDSCSCGDSSGTNEMHYFSNLFLE